MLRVFKQFVVHYPRSKLVPIVASRCTALLHAAEESARLRGTLSVSDFKWSIIISMYSCSSEKPVYEGPRRY